MIARFDKFERFETPLLTMCNPGSYVTLDNLLTNSVCALPYAKDIDATLNFGSLSELSFTLPLINDGVRQTYEGLETGRYIYVSDIGYFIIDDVNDSLTQEGRIKEISCVSVERELEELEAPFYKAGVYPLLSTDDKDGVLTLAMNKCPSWTVTYVDDAVQNRSRYFEIAESISIYEFFMNDLQDKFDCIFCFDIMNRGIAVYDRAGYASQHLTSIHLARNNIVEELSISQNYEDLFTALSVNGDEDMNIRRVNPIGTNVIYDFTYRKPWMSPELQDAITRWEQKVSSVESSYINLNKEYYSKYLAMSETQMDLDRLNTQLDIYYTCRDYIISGTIDTKKSSILRQLKDIGAVDADAGTDAVPVALATVNTKISALAISKAEKQALYAAQKAEADALKNQIDAIQSACSLSTTARDINNEAIFTDELLRELSAYIKQADYTDDNITKTSIMTQDEIFEWCDELMKRAKSQLAKVSTPCKKFEVTTRSFIFSSQFKHFTSQLVNGCIVTVETDDDQFEQLHLMTLDVDFESKSISLTFGNKYNQYDPRSLFDDVFGDVSKSKATLEYVTGIVEDMSGQVSEASRWIEEALTLTKDHALTSSNQEVVIDDGGYLGRERKTQKDSQGMVALDPDGNPIYELDSNGNPLYEGEQLRIVNNCIVFTDDGWETAKTAVGKVILGYDESGDPIYKYGVVGEVIIGKIIAGNNLIIAGGSESDGNYSVTIDENGLIINNGDIVINDPNGNKVFGVEDGQMFLDGSIVATGSLSIDSISVGDYTNYVNLSEETADVYGFKSASEYAADSTHSAYINEHWLTPISYPTSSPYFTPISKSYPCKIGDSFRITGQVYNRAYKGSSLNVHVVFSVKVRASNGVETTKYISSSATPLSSSGYTTLNETITINGESLGTTSDTPVSFTLNMATKTSAGAWSNVSSGWYAVYNLEVRRASAGEITAGILKSKDGQTYINLDEGDAQLTGSVKIKGDNYNVWLKSMVEDAQTEAGLFLTTADDNTITGRVALYDSGNGISSINIMGTNLALGASSEGYGNSFSIESSGYIDILSLNNIAITSNGYGYTSGDTTYLKGGNIGLKAMGGFSLSVPTYSDDTGMGNILGYNTIKKASKLSGAGWEIKPSITTAFIEADFAVINGIIYTGDYEEIWTGAHYMNSKQTADLKKEVSKFPNGIVLVWSAYTTSAQDDWWQYTFVPKEHVASKNGGGVSVFLSGSSAVAYKHVYIYDNKITGEEGNVENSTIGGITSTPRSFVLRKVLGI